MWCKLPVPFKIIVDGLTPSYNLMPMVIYLHNGHAHHVEALLQREVDDALVEVKSSFGHM